jgi:hypothetical protein
MVIKQLMMKDRHTLLLDQSRQHSDGPRLLDAKGVAVTLRHIQNKDLYSQTVPTDADASGECMVHVSTLSHPLTYFGSDLPTGTQLRKLLDEIRTLELSSADSSAQASSMTTEMFISKLGSTLSDWKSGTNSSTFEQLVQPLVATGQKGNVGTSQTVQPAFYNSTSATVTTLAGSKLINHTSRRPPRLSVRVLNEL